MRVKQCHVYHPWLGKENMPPIKMVMTGAWFIIVLPTLVVLNGIDPCPWSAKVVDVGKNTHVKAPAKTTGFPWLYIDVGLLEEGYGKKRVTQIPVGICLIPSHGRIDFRYVQPHSTVDASWCICHHMFTTIRSWPSSQPPYVMSLTSHVGTM